MLLVRHALANDNASHILLIPFISAWLIFQKRRQILERKSCDWGVTAGLFAVAATVYSWTLHSAAQWSLGNSLASYAVALVFFWIAGFALVFGREALQANRFAMLFLFLSVPLPDALLARTVFFLQKGSAEIAGTLFDLTGVPVLREGFVFHLSRVNIEVASECSGIRSSMALLILAVLVGHFLLRPFWKQLVFVLCGVFVMIVKNGVRIVTLTLLANYVNPGFLYGNLHREGGVVFFLLGLLLLVPVLWLLQRGEKPRRKTAEIPSA
ncbi:MAG: exosortase/archaeosortase family protein [Acidobacteriia bacterium]|nr:exosortase/archaeosortase family protein [Terriglobia bacterium]